jgi:hypothetical protein
MQRVAVLLVCLAALVSPISMSARNHRDARPGRSGAMHIVRFAVQRPDTDAGADAGRAQQHGEAPAAVTAAARASTFPGDLDTDATPQSLGVMPMLVAGLVGLVRQRLAPPGAATLRTRLARARVFPRAPPRSA